jgi:hypothetical protein
LLQKREKCKNYYLLKNPIIKNFLAGSMLVLFAISITPKIAVHSLVARHKDFHPATSKDMCSSRSVPDQVSRTGFHCAVDNLVVELPYLSFSTYTKGVIPESFRTYQVAADHQFYSFHHFIFGLRGPPVTV